MNSAFAAEAMRIWAAGGWLMAPLFVLAVSIYYTALELLLRLNGHVLLRERLHRRGESSIDPSAGVRSLLLPGAGSTSDVARHFDQMRNAYLQGINRRIRFLAVLTSAAPLLGLLGTVTGMLSTFLGLLGDRPNPLDAVAGGISEALITTQAGLIVSLPALVILSMIVRRRNLLAHAIARLERYNLRRVIRGVA